MIVIGYQGIGKSSVSKFSNRYIDLESSNFFIDGARATDWYKAYCNIAIALSKQGYVVFTSSHQVVRDYLKELGYEDVIIICPDVKLKRKWIKKLKTRYEVTKLDKDFKAYMNAKDRYTENIKELLDSGIRTYTIDKIDYDLNTILVQASINTKKKRVDKNDISE